MHDKRAKLGLGIELTQRILSEIDAKKKTIPNENHCDLSKWSLRVEERVLWTFSHISDGRAKGEVY